MAKKTIPLNEAVENNFYSHMSWLLFDKIKDAEDYRERCIDSQIEESGNEKMSWMEVRQLTDKNGKYFIQYLEGCDVKGNTPVQWEKSWVMYYDPSKGSGSVML